MRKRFPFILSAEELTVPVPPFSLSLSHTHTRSTRSPLPTHLYASPWQDTFDIRDSICLRVVVAILMTQNILRLTPDASSAIFKVRLDLAHTHTHTHTRFREYPGRLINRGLSD
jgi:hypothetical protein